MSNETKDGQKDAVDTRQKGPVLSDAKASMTVEEHAKRQKLTAPIFSAVMQSKGWASGKKVSKSEFEEAINAFLGAPMGGRK
jgi:hypothetical protein